MSKIETLFFGGKSAGLFALATIHRKKGTQRDCHKSISRVDLAELGV